MGNDLSTILIFLRGVILSPFFSLYAPDPLLMFSLALLMRGNFRYLDPDGIVLQTIY